MDMLIREDETLEDLQLKGLCLLQKKQGFRFGMDSVLLAHFAAIREQDTVVDFGTGTGILPLLLIGRNKGARFVGIEIQESFAEMARRTMALNHLEDCVSILRADAGRADELFDSCSVDRIICNPPYGQPGSTLRSPFDNRAIARNQEQDTLRGFFSAGFRILRGRGTFSLVYPAPQMLYVMELLQACHLEPKRFQLVYPSVDRPANLVLVEAVKDAKPTLHPMKPLIIYKKDGDLTNELKSVYHIMDEDHAIGMDSSS